MNLSFSINLIVILAIALMFIGALAAFIGVTAAADPEGRGGSFLILIPIGGVVFLGGAGYCLYRLCATFGFWP